MIGCDIVKINRFDLLCEDHVFLEKYFTAGEQEYVASKLKKSQTLAGIFACKEAVLKALKLGIGSRIRLKDVEILHDENGAPTVNVKGMENKIFEVSISHDGDYAMAVCLIS